MKIIEYACYDYSINETETQQNISKAIDLGATSVSVLPFSIATLKNLEEKIRSKSITTSSVIDFPFGTMDAKSRIFMASQLLKQKNDLNYLDLMIPTKIITNRKYDKLREEIKNILELALQYNIEIRYIIEYRVYSHEVLAKVCQIFKEFGINIIFPSSGTMLDNIDDNLIACNFLTTKTNIKTVCTGNIFNEKQAKSVKQTSNLYGVRFFYLSGLELFNKISI